jgi:hypothetical protein
MPRSVVVSVGNLWGPAQDTDLWDFCGARQVRGGAVSICSTRVSAQRCRGCCSPAISSAVTVHRRAYQRLVP